MSGCTDSGPPTAHLRGTITINGQPIPADAEAVIIIRSAGEGQARSTSARLEGGRFDVPDAPRGSVRIQFSIEQPTGVIAAFEPGAAPEMRYRSLVPPEHGKGIVREITGDDLDMQLDL
jgi:hypothetical protein